MKNRKKKKSKRFTNVVWKGTEVDLPVVLLSSMKLSGEEVTTQPEAIKLAVRRYLQMIESNGQSAPKEKSSKPVFADAKSAENYRLIVEAYTTVSPQGGTPNYSQLSRTTGLHRKTVKRHLDMYFEHKETPSISSSEPKTAAPSGVGF